jgi:hypothetical protein
MVASSHPPLTDVMTEHPCEQLHMDLVGLAHVRSAGGKWYALVVVEDYSRYAWVFFLVEKEKTFGFVRDLVLRLRNEMHGDAIRTIRTDNGSVLTVNSCIKDSQAYKSPVVVKGPFFPRVVNPRYRIRGTNV